MSNATPRERLQHALDEWSANRIIGVRAADLREVLEHPVSDLILLSLYETARSWNGTREEFLEAARLLSVGVIPK